MVDECTQIGKDKCFMVYYEQLVLQPKKTIENIFKFLNLPWIDSVLHHEELVGKKNISFKVSLKIIIEDSFEWLYRRTEHSSDQVIKPINLEALTKWIGHMPKDIKK